MLQQLRWTYIMAVIKLFESISSIDNQILCGSPDNINTIRRKDVYTDCIPILLFINTQWERTCKVGAFHHRCVFVLHIRVLSLFQAWQDSGSNPKL